MSNRRPVGAFAVAVAAVASLLASQDSSYASTVDPDASSRLNPGVAPGGNFDLSRWELQLPVGSTGKPTTISPARLKGSNGYHDKYFYTDKTDGSMTFWDPEKGVTTPGSKYPRTELREMTASGGLANWAMAGTHTLSATLKITKVPNHVSVGQIHLGQSSGSSKPLLELFYYSNGDVGMFIEKTPAGGNGVTHIVGNVPLGTKWSYVIGLTGGNTISLVLNGKKHTWPIPSSFKGKTMYFKAGDYDQSSGSSTTVGATVHFYALKFSHAR